MEMDNWEIFKEQQEIHDRIVTEL